MKNLFKSVLLTSLILAFVGCGTGGGGGGTTTTTTGPTPIVAPPNPLIVAAISGGSEIGVDEALIQLNKTNPAAATLTSNSLQTVINTTILPYLNDGSLHTSASIQAFLNSNLFTNVDPIVQQALAIAGALLDSSVQLPNDATYLNTTEIVYIQTFLNGVVKGCTDFSTKTSPKVIRSNHWINPPIDNPPTPAPVVPVKPTTDNKKTLD